MKGTIRLVAILVVVTLTAMGVAVWLRAGFWRASPLLTVPLIVTLWALLLWWRPRYMRWYWGQPVSLTCAQCGAAFGRPRGTLPPDHTAWLPLCTGCARLECLRNGECPDCQARFVENVILGDDEKLREMGLSFMHTCPKTTRHYSQWDVVWAKERWEARRYATVGPLEQEETVVLMRLGRFHAPVLLNVDSLLLHDGSVAPAASRA